MCGFAALFRWDGQPVQEAEIIAMRDTLVHRGPDDAGVWIQGSTGLGFRRLSIIDLEGGHQPMANRAGDAMLVFNGEIYNYRELRRHLEERGVELHTSSDTETILGLYDLYGEDCVQHLEGMFAFVLWDSARHRLLAARDRLGIKPLYLYRAGTTLALASEIKAFFPLEEWRGEVDREAVPEYLIHRHLAGTRTLFRGVERLAPGERLVADGRNERRELYWQLPHPATGSGGKGEEARWREQLAELMDGVIDGHMLADVPLGTFNSGGLDSSLVTALVAGKDPHQLNTYSVGFDDPAFDESPYADLVAQRFETRHHRLFVDEKDYARDLPLAIWHHDEPLNHPHSVHLLRLSRLAKEKVTVVLTGEGSDELFGGYTRYRLPALLDRLPLGLPGLQGALSLLAGGLPQRQRERIRTVLRPRRGTAIDGLSLFTSPEQVASVLPSSLSRAAFEPRPGCEPAPPAEALARVLRLDQETYLQSLLRRMDKMSMAASLEGRVPFLDHKVVELAARVPPGLKVAATLKGLETKFLVKRLAGPHLPDRIIYRKKAGFAVPVSRWLRPGGALGEMLDLLVDERAAERGLFLPEAVTRLVEEHRQGRRDHGEILWGLVNLELWQRSMIDTTAPPEASSSRPAGSR